ncbi:hypothetical protein DCS_01486 [Drechmeria coniospora]|uniref:GOLD domain-containing protein n=1 Tax=Drechmeria coniospora TaxID=98403 RepID=A0A151GTA6_DRECN|nr:hypothetical protein DCS_01486 [Drechmeria coniospora]KYK60349.1 hypothetical protein DCS_01486 [Drechmeria coniospora]
MKGLLPLLSLLSGVQALFFYVDAMTPKCFYEELPKDTLVVGHYTAKEWEDRAKNWQQHSGLNIYITVDVRLSPPRPKLSVKSSARVLTDLPFQEVFDNDHRVVSQRGQSSGRFTFTAQEPGDHKICFQPSSSSGKTGWLSLKGDNGGIKLNLDLVIGETNQIESSDKDKLHDISSRVKDLHARLNDIRREQIFQREREAEFRDQSENTNSRVIRWILIQLVIIGITCAWQLSHLRSFFIKQKLT